MLKSLIAILDVLTFYRGIIIEGLILKSILIRIIVCLVLLYPGRAGALEFTPDEKAFITSNPEIRVAMMPDFSPFFIHKSRMQRADLNMICLHYSPRERG